MRSSLLALSAGCLLLAVACGEDTNPTVDAGTGAVGSDAAASTPSDTDGGNGDSGPNANAGTAATPTTGTPAAPGFDNAYSWQTGDFEVEAGKERYLCFASKLTEDLTVDAFTTTGQSFVHHLIFSRSAGTDKQGFEDCPEAFRSGWQPLFITGAGSSTLELPSDAGHKLAKDSSVTIQMHLLNTGDQPVKGAVNIKMRRSSHPSPRPVSTYIFGTQAVKLPPKQKSQIVGTCKSREKLTLVAGFPHMHLMGAAMRFEVGPTPEALKQHFKRDPFNFDAQNVERVAIDIAAGDTARVTCDYNNTLDQEITYGESTNNEMCYFIGFAVDRERQGACIEFTPRN